IGASISRIVLFSCPRYNKFPTRAAHAGPTGLSTPALFRNPKMARKTLDSGWCRVLNSAQCSDHSTTWAPRSSLSMAQAKVEIEVVHKTKVYKTVSEQIQRMIRDGLMKAGDWLPPERELAEMFNVSRTSLRDAIRNLEQLGLVE